MLDPRIIMRWPCKAAREVPQLIGTGMTIADAVQGFEVCNGGGEKTRKFSQQDDADGDHPKDFENLHGTLLACASS